jgi:hypothetical protein
MGYDVAIKYCNNGPNLHSAITANPVSDLTDSRNFAESA